MWNRYDYERRSSAKYLAKKSLVKDIWIVSGLIMLCSQSLAMIASLTLLTTFLAFAILDETP